ncbi:HetZ-related protein 2 [Calothrix sp. PCC 6303]|uniref:HetZ-related protein 2 n=1 Tax=Calothrix sp. PCC 6303 TaxID=1170562 RepID=UPI0002A03795|nr:HetZ-related protein 2 [Calothrix sp. PCC 6303]AFZ02142.1 Tetratricopeptide TPR_1 repeat-containing protein [Calothrix sp. PCC 6303]
MVLDCSDWDEDLPPEPEEAYQDLIRVLRRNQGFGLFFVQCTPKAAESAIAQIPKDVPQRKIEVLRLVEAIDSLYGRVGEFVKGKQVDILLITGLEYSLYKYEKRNFGQISEGEFSNLSSVPPILNHLNQQRERFRDHFNFTFVFLLRSFSISYLINRAPDFFDWRSGIFELATTHEVVEQESSRLLLEGDYEEYRQLTHEQKIEKILEFQELLADKYHQELTDLNRPNLLFKLGNLLAATNEFEPALTAFDQALKIKPELVAAWNNRGAVLCDRLQRYDDAIASYDEALKIQPDYHQAWYNRGVALCKANRLQEALDSLDQAIAIQPNDSNSWRVRGIILHELDRQVESTANHQKADELEAINKVEPNLTEKIQPAENDREYSIALNKFIQNSYFRYQLASLLSGFVGYEEYNIIPSVAAKIAQYWRSRLYFDYREKSNKLREAIIDWLLGIDLQRFEKLSADELEIAKQSIECRYKILQQRYLFVSREQAYRNLLIRLSSLVMLREKIKTWVASSRDRQRTVMDVLQEVIQETLQIDKYIQEQMVIIDKCTKDPRIKNALLFATLEDYCFRPIRNLPLIYYRFVDYLQRNQSGGLTQVPRNDLIKLISEDTVVTDNPNKIPLFDHNAIAQYRNKQALDEARSLSDIVRLELEKYLVEQIGEEAVEWLRLYLKGKSPAEIAKILNKPITEICRLREQVSYYAVRIFALKGEPELIDNWLEISLSEHNFGLTQKQLEQLVENITPLQNKILQLRKNNKSMESIAKELKLEIHQVIAEWAKVYLAAQNLRNQEN